MILSDKIKRIPALTDFVFWTATAGNDNIAKMARVSAFVVQDDGERITFFLPTQLFNVIEPTLKKDSNISFLMISLNDFESYQVKGKYLHHKNCSEENIDFYRLKIMRVIDIANGMGLGGNGLFGYLLKQPSVALTMHCTEMYEQTPKPGTGGIIID